MFHQTVHRQDSRTATKGSSCKQTIVVSNFIFKYTAHLIIYLLALCIEYLLRLTWLWKSRMQVDDWRTQPVQKRIAVIPSHGLHKMSLPRPRPRDSPQSSKLVQEWIAVIPSHQLHKMNLRGPRPRELPQSSKKPRWWNHLRKQLGMLIPCSSYDTLSVCVSLFKV